MSAFSSSQKVSPSRPRLDSKSSRDYDEGEDGKVGPRKHTTYFMKIEVGSQVHTISKRYTEFLMLHQKVREDYYKPIEDFDFPMKVWLTRFSEKTITSRREKFEQYLQLLFRLAQKHRKIKVLLDEFLGQPTPVGGSKKQRTENRNKGTSGKTGIKTKSESGTVYQEGDRMSTPVRPLNSLPGLNNDGEVNRHSLANPPMTSPVVHNDIPSNFDNSLSSGKSISSPSSSSSSSSTSASYSSEKKGKSEKKKSEGSKRNKTENEKEGLPGPVQEQKQTNNTKLQNEASKKHINDSSFLHTLYYAILINMFLVYLVGGIALSFPSHSKITSIFLIIQNFAFGYYSHALIKDAKEKSSL